MAKKGSDDDDNKIVPMPKQGSGKSDPAKKRNARAGTLKKPDKDKPAEVESGGPKKPEFSPGSIVEQKRVFWKNGSTTFYVRQQGVPAGVDEWRELNVTALDEELQEEFMLTDKAPPGHVVSELQMVKNFIRKNKVVDLGLSLAGYDAGVYRMLDQRVLVRRSPRRIEPVAGGFPSILGLLEAFSRPLENDGENKPPMPTSFLAYRDQKLGRTEGRKEAQAIWDLMLRDVGDQHREYVLDQSVIFFAWLKLRMEVYWTLRRNGEAVMRPGQALFLVGPPDAGKGLLQNFVITPLLGGRMGDPKDVLLGESSFNADLFAAEHMCLEEMPAKLKAEDKRHFSEMIKKMITRVQHRYHPKGKDAIMLQPRWTWTLSVNDSQDALKAIPNVTADLADKIHLLHLRHGDIPPIRTTEEYLAFGRKLASEVPSFLEWLMRWEIPDALIDGRFGMVGIHAPELVRQLFEDTPAGTLLEMIDEARFGIDKLSDYWCHPSDVPLAWIRRNCPQVKDWTDAEVMDRTWKGKADQVREILESADCSLQRQAEGLFKYAKPGNLLARLTEEEPGRVRQWRDKWTRGYIIFGHRKRDDEGDPRR